MSEPARQSGAYRILVVDDDSMHRDTLEDYLRLAGYDTAQAENGEVALELINFYEPDLVLLDVNMPVMDGYATLRKLRADKRFRDVPVLLLSSADRTNMKVKGFELGADDYVTKPFERTELLARVRAGLRRAARYQNLGAAMVGDLQDFGIDGLLQTLHLGMRGARVRFPDVDAEIETRHGVMSDCRFRKFEGHEALIRILLQKQGRFSVDFEDGEPRTDGSRPSLDHALVDAMVALDEARLMISRVGAQDLLLDLQREETGIPALEAMRKSFPIRLGELVVAMPGELRSNASTVASAFQRGLLFVIE